MINTYNLKGRLATIGKRQIHLLPEIEKRTGMRIAPCELSAALSGYSPQHKPETIRRVSNEIVKEWETELNATAQESV